MNTIGSGNRRPVGTIAIVTTLAVLGLGLAGCQTTTAASLTVESERVTRDAPASAVQAERTARAAQARYEGLAEYYAELAGRPAAAKPSESLPIVADRLEERLAAATVPDQTRRVVADRVAE
jgi:hypothetical protein